MARDFENDCHIVSLPKWISYINATRFVLTVAVVVLASVMTIICGAPSAFVLTLFTALATIVILLYNLVAVSRKPVLYNGWAVLSLETLETVLWLVSFALCATWAATFHGLPDKTDRSYGFCNADYSPEDLGLQRNAPVGYNKGRKYLAGLAVAGACAGIATVEFVLFSLVLVVFTQKLYKHYKAGYPTVYGSSTTAEDDTSTRENNGVKA